MSEERRIIEVTAGAGSLAWQDNGPKKVAANGWGAIQAELVGFSSRPASCPTYTWEKGRLHIHVRAHKPADLHASMDVEIEADEAPLYASKFDRDIAIITIESYQQGLLDPTVEEVPESLKGFLSFQDLKASMEVASVNAMGAVLDLRIESVANYHLIAEGKTCYDYDVALLLVDNFLQRWEVSRLVENSVEGVSERARQFSGNMRDYWLDFTSLTEPDWEIKQRHEDGAWEPLAKGRCSPEGLTSLRQKICELAQLDYINDLAQVENCYAETLETVVASYQKKHQDGETVPTLSEMIDDVLGDEG